MHEEKDLFTRIEEKGPAAVFAFKALTVLAFVLSLFLAGCR